MVVLHDFHDLAQTCSLGSQRVTTVVKILCLNAHVECLKAYFNVNYVSLLQPPAHFCSGSHGPTLWVSSTLSQFALLNTLTPNEKLLYYYSVLLL